MTKEELFTFQVDGIEVNLLCILAPIERNLLQIYNKNSHQVVIFVLLLKLFCRRCSARVESA